MMNKLIEDGYSMVMNPEQVAADARSRMEARQAAAAAAAAAAAEVEPEPEVEVEVVPSEDGEDDSPTDEAGDSDEDTSDPEISDECWTAGSGGWYYSGDDKIQGSGNLPDGAVICGDEEDDSEG